MTATIEATVGGVDAATPAAGEPGKLVDDRLYALDLLRFFAAMAVMVFHVIPIAAYRLEFDATSYFGYAVSHTARYGRMGVHLFFIISGFVICMSSWGRSVGAFFTSRVSRLMPAYIFAVLLTATLMIGFLHEDPPASTVLINLTMVQTMLRVPNLDGVYWTLLVEAKFYLLFAFVVWRGLTYRRVVAFCALWMIASLFALTANNQLLMAIVQPEYSPLFVAGVLLYLMRRFGTSPLLWAMLVASWIFAVNDVRIDIGGQKVDPARPLIAYLVLAGFYLVMTAAALGWLSWLRWRGLVVIGALTYPLYLTHFYVSNTIMLRLHGRLPNAAVVALTLAAILVIAYLIHLFVERPVARLIRKGLRQSFAKMRGSEPRPRHQAA